MNVLEEGFVMVPRERVEQLLDIERDRQKLVGELAEALAHFTAERAAHEQLKANCQKLEDRANSLCEAIGREAIAAREEADVLRGRLQLLSERAVTLVMAGYTHFLEAARTDGREVPKDIAVNYPIVLAALGVPE